jgi:hypothetical protein
VVLLRMENKRLSGFKRVIWEDSHGDCELFLTVLSLASHCVMASFRREFESKRLLVLGDSRVWEVRYLGSKM